MEEQRPLQKNQSYQSDASSMGAMVEISLTGESLGKTIYEDDEAFNVPDSPKHSYALMESIKPIENFDFDLLPHILKFLPPQDLQTCQLVSWGFFKVASEALYKHIEFSQLSGSRLERFLVTLSKSILSAGRRFATIDYCALVGYLTINHIVFEDPPSVLQSWAVVRDVIGLCAKTIVGLSLGVGDESFMELSSDYVYLHTEIELPSLTHLALSSKCQRVPPKLMLELLRASPIGGLESLKFTRCLTNMSQSGWFLICERGGTSLHTLALTPSSGPNMLGWEEQYYNTGLEQITAVCTSLSRLDLSGHAMQIPQKALESLCENQNMTEFYAPCTTNDAHLSTTMELAIWEHLRVFGLSCLCVDGEMKESKKKGMCCNMFTDHLMLTFLEFLMNIIGKPQIYLPAFLVGIKNGKRVDTVMWLDSCEDVKRQEQVGLFVYKEKIYISVPTNRLAQFL